MAVVKISDLIKKLQAVPDQKAEVRVLVYRADDGNIVTADLEGPATQKIMEAIAASARATKRLKKGGAK